MSKEIVLTKGKLTIVDDEDYDRLLRTKWYASSHGYATNRSRKGVVRYMHREIMNCPENMLVDHINHNGLDNRKSNLRICSKKQNQQHQKKRKLTCSSKYKGVHFSSRCNRWVVQIQRKYVGQFLTEIEAAKAYNANVKRFHGEFAELNVLYGL